MSNAHTGLRHESVHEHARGRWRRRQAILTLGALGVVYGDIGTSPLYAVRQSVLATGGQMPMEVAIMGAISLIFWSLIIIVTIKYVVFILRADKRAKAACWRSPLSPIARPASRAG